MNDLEQRLQKIEESLVKLKSAQVKKVSWQEKTAASGIQIASGPTTVTKTGVILGVNVVPTSPTQVGAVFIVKVDDSDQIAIIDSQFIKFEE